MAQYQKKTKKPAVSTTQIREKGRNIFQPNLINWSYLYLGVEALTHKKINKIKIFHKILSKKTIFVKTGIFSAIVACWSVILVGTFLTFK